MKFLMDYDNIPGKGPLMLFKDNEDGTLSLATVEDVEKAIESSLQTLKQELVEAKKEIERLTALTKDYFEQADFATDQQNRALKAEATITEQKKVIEQLTNRVNLLSVSANTIRDAYDNGYVKEVEGKLAEQQKIVKVLRKGLEDVVMHLEGSTCDCGEELGDIDAADSARAALLATNITKPEGEK